MIPKQSINLKFSCFLLMTLLLLFSGFCDEFFCKLQQYHVTEIRSTVEIKIYLEDHGITFTVFLLLTL